MKNVKVSITVAYASVAEVSLAVPEEMPDGAITIVLASALGVLIDGLATATAKMGLPEDKREPVPLSFDPSESRDRAKSDG